MTIYLQLKPLNSGRTAVMLDGVELATGRGGVVCNAARKLIDLGHDPLTELRACRSGELCLSGTLGAFAALSVSETENHGPRFAPFRPAPVRGLGEGSSE